MANRSRRRSRRRKRRSNENSSGALVYFAGIVGAGFVIFALITMLGGDTKLDTISGCPVGDPHKRNWLERQLQPLNPTTVSILFDTTDPIRSAVKDKVINIINKRVDDAAELDRIRIYMVDPSDQVSLPVEFDSCKPQANSGLPDIIDRFRRSNFDRTLRKALDTLEYSRKSSPIIESLASVAANFPLDGSEKEIILVSDLIQKSDVLDQYDPNWLNIYNSNPRSVNDRSPDLLGVRMTILFITKPNISTQNTDLRAWWERFLLGPADAPIEKFESHKITG